MPTNIYAKLVKAFAGTSGLVDASDVETTGNGNAQTDLDNLNDSILSWKFNGTVTDASNPGATFLALNNAAKDNASIISFNTTSNIDSARFDELLLRLDVDDTIFLQQRNDSNRSILYRVLNPATVNGTKVNVSIVRERDQGGEFTDQAVLNVGFFHKSAGSASRFVRVNNTDASPIITVDATNDTTFASSLSSVTLKAGQQFPVATAGEPFAGQITRAKVGDIIEARVDSPQASDHTHWVIHRNPLGLPVNATSDLFLSELTSSNGFFGFSSNVKIDRDNVDANYRNVIEGDSAAGLAGDITALRNRLDTLYPLAQDVTVLDDWASIYNPTRAVETIEITQGYTLLADFRGTDAADHYESAGVTYNPGTNVSDYSGLSDDTHRAFGFSVSGPSDQTLLWINDSGTYIPFIDMTATGNFRVNNYTPARAQDEQVTNHFNSASLDASSVGSGTLSVGGDTSTYLVPEYPGNTTSQTRVVSIDLDVLINGTNTNAGGGIDVDIPDTNLASTFDIQHTFFTGFPLNRHVTATVRVATRVSGADLLLDLTLISAPSDVTFSVNNVTVFQNYTASVIIPRVDDFLTITDAGGDIVFSGATELLINFDPIPGNDTTIEGIPVVRNNTTGAVIQANNVTLPVPQPPFNQVRVPDTIEFRTYLPDHYLSHATLAHLVGNRATKWVYGLAPLLSANTEHAITEPVDLAQGSKLNGVQFSRDITATAIGGTGDSVLTLPDDYTSFEMVFANVVEDGGQTMHYMGSTRHLEANATIATVRVAGNDFADWNRTTRQLTLHETTDTWEQAILLFPRQS